MTKLFADLCNSKFRFLPVIFFLILFTGNNLAAQDTIDNEFPWEIFYPAFIKKPVDNDNDGFLVRQGDCNDNNGSVYPGAEEICGDGVDQDCDGNDLECPPPCVNIAGDWHITETLSVTICEGGDCQNLSESGSGTVTYQQDGCNISYDVYLPGYGTYTRNGSIDGSNFHFSGIFLIRMPSGCKATTNVLNIYGTVNGDQSNSTGTGIAEGTCDGSNFKATGQSISTGTRLSSSFTRNALTGTELDKNPSAAFSKDGKIFSFIAHQNWLLNEKG